MRRWCGLLLFVTACEDPNKPEVVDDPVVLRALDQVEDNLSALSELEADADAELVRGGVEEAVDALRIMAIAHFVTNLIGPNDDALDDILGFEDDPTGTTWDGTHLRSVEALDVEGLPLTWDVDVRVRDGQAGTIMNGSARIFWQSDVLGVPLDRRIAVFLEDFHLDEDGCPNRGTLDLLGRYETLVFPAGTDADLDLEVTWFACGLRQVIMP